MTQWHPIFSYLLRATLHEYYDVQTNVPVGDLPRQADIIVLRRSSARNPPFQTLWRHLSHWNILEFKGPSESARVSDIDLLVEVGLGIHRRLSQEETESKLARGEVSFWYLANSLGKRFLRDVVEFTGELTAVSHGLWHGRVLGRPLWLVSNSDVPIDVESAPVSAVSKKSVKQAFELAEIAVTSDELWQTYGPLLEVFYPKYRKEFKAMATKQRRPEIDWDKFLLKKIAQADHKKLIEGVGAKTFIDEIGLDGILAALTPEQRRELVKKTESWKK